MNFLNICFSQNYVLLIYIAEYSLKDFLRQVVNTFILNKVIEWLAMQHLNLLLKVLLF